MKTIAIAAVLSLIILSSIALAGGQIFDTPMLYHSRPDAKDMAIGDFNDDGILDIVQGQGFSKLIMFHIGNGDGTFQSLYPLAFNNYSSVDYLSVGDVNNDGLDDLVTLAPGSSSYLRIYLSDVASDAVPNLSETPVMVNAGSYVYYLALADEDNDGNLDILLGGDYQGAVVCYNNGDDTFAEPVAFGPPGGGMLTADLNHDDYPDFALSWASGELWVTLSDGLGGYQITDTVSTSNSVYGSLMLFDLTGDGGLDLAYTGTDATDYWVEIAVNLGDGAFSDGIKYDILPPGHKTFSVGNVFGDNFNDIISVNPDDYYYSVIDNNGSGSFSPPVEYVADYRPGMMQAFDFNGDGYDDLLNNGWTALGVYLNHGDGTFPIPEHFDVPEFGSNSLYLMKETVSYDFNGDLYPDIAIFGQIGGSTTYGGHFYYIFHNDGTGQFGSPDVQVMMDWVPYYKSTVSDCLVYGDFIGDSSTDLVVCGTNNYRIFTGPIQSGGTGSGVNFAITGSPVGIAADVDHDNDLDLVLSTSNDLLVKYNNNGIHTVETTFDNVAGSIITSIDTLDIDNDGDLDFVAGSQNNNRCYTIENDGDGFFSALQTLSVPPPTTSKLIDVVAADFNNDGYGDAAVLWQHAQSQTTGLVEPVVYILMNDGAGTLTHTNTYHYIENARRIVAADFDNDGDYDLTLNGSYPKGAAVLINDGTGSFEMTQANYAATGPGGSIVQITANDFDRDGNQDIAVFHDKNAMSNTIGTISILRNTGLATGVCTDTDDFDSDGIGNRCDNCLHVENSNQADLNEDGIGDVCQSEGATPMGSSVPLHFDLGVDITFDNVSSAGITEVTLSPDGPFANTFTLAPVDIPAYLHISSTAGHTGSINICVDYPDSYVSAEDEADFGLWHYEGGEWIEITTTLDTLNNRVCGTSATLSPFAMGFRLPGCCGLYTSGFTGNTDCNPDGKRNIADITRLIDRVYLSKTPLCCEENGNVDGDVDGKLNIADITRLIDNVYLSKQQTAACQ